MSRGVDAGPGTLQDGWRQAADFGGNLSGGVSRPSDMAVAHANHRGFLESQIRGADVRQTSSLNPPSIGLT